MACSLDDEARRTQILIFFAGITISIGSGAFSGLLGALALKQYPGFDIGEMASSGAVGGALVGVAALLLSYLYFVQGVCKSTSKPGAEKQVNIWALAGGIFGLEFMSLLIGFILLNNTRSADYHMQAGNAVGAAILGSFFITLLGTAIVAAVFHRQGYGLGVSGLTLCCRKAEGSASYSAMAPTQSTRTNPRLAAGADETRGLGVKRPTK